MKPSSDPQLCTRLAFPLVPLRSFRRTEGEPAWFIGAQGSCSEALRRPVIVPQASVSVGSPWGLPQPPGGTSAHPPHPRGGFLQRSPPTPRSCAPG